MAAFELVFSHRMETLFDSLAEHIRQPAAGMGLLTPETVLLDNRVLGEWLNIQLAQQHSVAANMCYLQPSALFWQLARALLPDEPASEAPLGKTEMTWKLYSLFADPALMAKPVLQPVASYLNDESCRPLKRYQLAVAIADLFDQYLIYRSDWLLGWQSGKRYFSDDDNEAWQAELWRQLALSDHHSLSHRALMEQKLHAYLAENDSETVCRRLSFVRLSVFGITSLAPQMVRLLVLLAQHLPVRLYVLNPCREYWELIQSARQLARNNNRGAVDELYYEIGNPLLASQGEQLREFIQLLQEHADADFLPNADTEPQTLLQQIQHDILTLSYKGRPAAVDYVSDGEKQPLVEDLQDPQRVPSIHIHRCHGPQREVEVLHDQLRDMLARMPGLNPRDIVVMMPKVSTYAPYIHAIFTRDEETSRIPYQISDQTLADQSTLLTSFDTLLGLSGSRFTLSEVLSLLEVPAVQKAFAMTQDDFDILRGWLAESGIRWGRDAAHRMQHGLPAYHEYSWSFGLDRLLAGYAMAVDDDAPQASLLQPADGMQVLPYDGIEGSNTHILDSFLCIWQKIEQLAARFQRPRSLADWHVELLQLLDVFYLADNDDDRQALIALREAITQLGKTADRQWCQADVPIEVIRNSLKPVMEQGAGGRHHWQEGVKFCSLLPMRAVPFRVVYILGMNNEDYPRRIERKGFDLMRNKRRAGDRASRIDDRWLFLEALLSARDVFHVSYNARDMHRNEQREPSVVLSELIDYLRHGYLLEQNRLFTDHPLQPFSEQYFRQDRRGLSPRLLSFDRQSYAVAAARQMPAADPGQRWTLPATAEQDISASLDSFVRFFCKPWQWFFRERQRALLHIGSDDVQDEENFDEGDGLKKWQLRDELIRSINSNKQLAGYPQQVEQLEILHRASADWPLGIAGQRLKQSLLDDEKNAAFYTATAGLQAHAMPLELSIDTGNGKLRLSGELMLFADDGQYRYILHSASRRSIDRELGFAITTALLAQAGTVPLAGAEAIYYEDKKQQRAADCLDSEALDKKPHRQFLATLAQLFIRYQHSGLPFEPAWSSELYAAGRQGDSPQVFDHHEQAGRYWHEVIQNDIVRRSYFVSEDAICCDTFRSVSDVICKAWADWQAGGATGHE